MQKNEAILKSENQQRLSEERQLATSKLSSTSTASINIRKSSQVSSSQTRRVKPRNTAEPKENLQTTKCVTSATQIGKNNSSAKPVVTKKCAVVSQSQIDKIHKLPNSGRPPSAASRTTKNKLVPAHATAPFKTETQVRKQTRATERSSALTSRSHRLTTNRSSASTSSCQGSTRGQLAVMPKSSDNSKRIQTKVNSSDNVKSYAVEDYIPQEVTVFSANEVELDDQNVGLPNVIHDVNKTDKEIDNISTAINEISLDKCASQDCDNKDNASKKEVERFSLSTNG